MEASGSAERQRAGGTKTLMVMDESNLHNSWPQSDAAADVLTLSVPRSPTDTGLSVRCQIHNPTT